ncbi:MAG: aldose 1-epimerase [Devosia sp.]|nr:aldose 1-epimerase [Devosia sp.]
MQAVTIRSGPLVAEIAPRLGAGMLRFECDGVPLFRGTGADAQGMDLASIILVPWSNRISGGGFNFEGRFHALAPNVPGETYPIHGNGFQLPWTVTAATGDAVELALESEGPNPYIYVARMRYALTNDALSMELTVTNRAVIRLPFGLGFHPYLARTPDTEIRADFGQVWLETADHLPAALVDISARPDWNFRQGKALPADWINNAFPGWDGRALVTWPSRHLTLAIEASAALSCAILYSPSKTAESFCLEPVTHAVDAINGPGGAEANDMAVLDAGESQTVSCRFRVGDAQ